MLPKIGQMLYIQVDSPIPDEENKMYKSRIYDVDDSTYSIEVPLDDEAGTYKRLYVGERITVHYITEGGVKNYFNTSVTGTKEDVVRLYLIQQPHPNAITKVQRRHFLRVPANLEIAVNYSGVRFLAVTDDVSGGGLSFVYDGKFSLAEQMELSGWLLVPFRNDSLAHVPFEGEVVRVKKYDDGNKQLAMLKFSNIRPQDRETIVRYCFERQLELRK